MKQSKQYETLFVEKAQEGVAVLTMNHPENLNALSGQTISDLLAVIDELEKDIRIRVVVITGSGKAFVAGADIAYMKSLAVEAARRFAYDTELVYEKIHRSGKVYIAAVNGFALGGGCEFMLACDLCVASDRAKFGLPEVGLGTLPGGGGTQRLPLRVGAQMAKALILTGDVISAARAEEIGLILKAVPAGQLMAEAMDLANRILKNAPLAVKYAKECIQHSMNPLLYSGIEFENTLLGACFATDDLREGMTAFLEKRDPEYSKTL